MLLVSVSVAFKEKQADEPPKTEKAPAAADKGKGAKGGKGAKDKGGKDKDGKGSRPPSQQFDIGKPHWTLRVVSDASCSVSMTLIIIFPKIWICSKFHIITPDNFTTE